MPLRDSQIDSERGLCLLLFRLRSKQSRSRAAASSTPAYNNYQPTVLEGADKERVIRRMNQYSEGLGVSFDDEGYASPGEE